MSLQTVVMDGGTALLDGLTLKGVRIRHDGDGRYCLNDFHEAAGGLRGDNPGEWLRLKRTAKLIEALKAKAGIPVISSTQRVGTFAAPPLVIAYAEWVSAEFHVDVIQTFLAARGVLVDAQPSAPVPPSDNRVSQINVDLALYHATIGTLGSAPSSRVAMLKRIGEANGANTEFLPAVVVDGPPDGDTQSSEATASLTELLRERDATISVHDFYAVLEEAGIVVQRTRRTTQLKRYPSGQKRFWNVTKAGRRFAKNLTPVQSPRETVPHFYVSRFNELRRFVEPVYRDMRRRALINA